MVIKRQIPLVEYLGSSKALTENSRNLTNNSRNLTIDVQKQHLLDEKNMREKFQENI